MQIADLNFGIRKWYLRPPVIVKFSSALMTLVLLVYMFVMGGRFSDVLWKTVVGRSHVVFVLFMVITMISVALTFLFYFYKIFVDRAMICFFLSIALAAVFVVEYLAFCIGYVSQAKCEKYAELVIGHLKSAADAASSWFFENYHVTAESDGLGDAVMKYARSRTVDLKSGLSGIAMVWIVLYVVLVFVVLFESKTDGTNQSGVRDLRPDVET